MLDIKLIRQKKESIEKLLRTKDPEVDLNPVLTLDERIRQIKTEDEHLKAKRNDLSKQVGEMKRKGEDATDLMEEVRQIGEKSAALGEELREKESEFFDRMSRIPNIPMEDVKASPNPADNVVIKTFGEKRTFDFAAKNHVELNERLHLFDFQRAAKVSGTGWPAYHGMGARLEWALINYMIDTQIRSGFEFWLPPVLVRPPIMYGSGQIPKFDGQYYTVADPEHPLYLIPTAEVALNGLHYDEILPEESLPLKYAAYTPCFRREAGAAGAQERGLIRVHQFNKVEMFVFCKPEESAKMMDQMVAVAESILQGLGLHYRLSLLVTGDMSFTAAKTIDVEVYLPGQNRYYEVSSISNCTDYQARRSQTRYKGKAGKPELVHTLNGSGLATSRLLVSLLENNQNPDGSVNLPPVLQEMLGMNKLTPA